MKLERLIMLLIDIMEKDMKEALSKSKKNYLPLTDIWDLESKVKGILSIGHSEQVLYYEIGTSSATLLLLFIAAFIFILFLTISLLFSNCSIFLSLYLATLS